METLGANRRCLVDWAAALVPIAYVFAVTTSQAAPVAVGAIDQVDRSNATITVLGQKFPLTDASIVLNSQDGSAPQRRGIFVGQLVWIDAEVSADGKSKHTVYSLPERYTEGSTQVFVAGAVSAVTNAGTLRVGGLTVDFTSALSRGAFEVSAGDWVELFGTQPARNGLLLADTVKIVRGVGGSGTLGVGGSGTLGVGGSGTLGVGGSGTLGVGGSGIQ
ncbi:MAG: DUF5666 domain-containing protein [Gammaproteobacteria bacterium]